MKSRCYILKLDCRMFSFSVKRHKERPLAENTQKGAFSTLFPFHLKNVIFTQKLWLLHFALSCKSKTHLFILFLIQHVFPYLIWHLHIMAITTVNDKQMKM